MIARVSSGLPYQVVGYCLGNAVVQISILRMIAGVSDLRLKGTLRIVLHTRYSKHLPAHI
jgi:hypothetical protein